MLKAAAAYIQGQALTSFSIRNYQKREIVVQEYWDVTVLCKHIPNFEDNQSHINIYLSCVQYYIIGGNKFDIKVDSF